MSARVDRSTLQVRIFQLGAEPAEDLSATTTPSERLAMVGRLSEDAWLLAGLPMPGYSRQQIPVRRVTLASKS
ncbi:MAG: hypothetical protein M3O61_08295 [Gemmatimonadota bacterium]|nr:hypothetical protein [Gemmatimonadota bacterium]